VRRQLLIVLLAAIAGLAAWVGGNVLRYGGFKAGLAHVALDSPLLMRLASVSTGIINPTLPAGVKALDVGDARPDLALPDTARRLRHLSEWDGKPLVLNFWATWCKPCLKEMPLFDALQRDSDAGGVQVVGIGLDDAGKVRSWTQAHPRAFPILLGDALGYDVSHQFGNRVNAVPYSVLIGPDGRLLRRHLGSFDNEASLRDWALKQP
jgi:peroxiredoxin